MRDYASEVTLPEDSLAWLMLSSPTIAMNTRSHAGIRLVCAIRDKTVVTWNCMRIFPQPIPTMLQVDNLGMITACEFSDNVERAQHFLVRINYM